MSHLENNNPNNNSGNFNLPGNYFSKNAKSIANKIEWIEEHKQFTTLEKLKNQHGFIVPENYFDNTITKLELVNYPTLANLKHKAPFIIPENYFEHNAIVIESELLDKTTLLNQLQKQNPFTVPQNYFEENTILLPEKLAPTAKVISLYKPKIWMAAAAVLFIVLGAWMFNYYVLSPNSNNCTSLACLDNNELLKTKHLNNLDEEELSKIVNLKKLEEKLNYNTKPNTPKNTTDSLKDEALDEVIDEL